MFIDEAEIYIKGGKGGNGAVSFRHEKYIPFGGPDGGDGGNGGSVYIEVDEQTHGLSDFYRQKKFLASDGQKGMGKNMHGKNGEDLILKVPSGTIVYEKDEILFDLVREDERVLLVSGGNGGWGNQHFASSIKQAPEWAKDGKRGESKKLKLILKKIADVGLIGLPNAGKSTLLSVLTSAKPKIADYPFTTLEPNLGTFADKEVRLIMADIPGLIAGASKGKGLGDKFLKHVERTKTLVHLIDANSDDVVSDYKTIRAELGDFSKDLLLKKEIVVLNKIDSIDEEKINKQLIALKKLKLEPLAISAATHKNISELIQNIKKNLA